MANLNNKIKTELLNLGADIVGFGSLNELPSDVRNGLPIGISVAVVYPKEAICGISELPTREYYECYNKLNERLDMIVTCGTKSLREMGYKAIAQTRKHVGSGEGNDNTLLPHKTVATRAGIGWIGKSALLVTEEYGSALRISSILTDAPLVSATAVNASKCGDCMICTKACPGEALSGKLWKISMHRDRFFNSVKCRKAARERSKLGFGGENVTICGKCIEVCPYTKAYIAK